MFCENVLELYPVGQPILPGNVGILKLIIGILYMAMVGITIYWIHYQEKMARNGDEGAVKSVIFPIFTKMMWMSAFSSLFIGILLIFVPAHVTNSNSGFKIILYPLAWTFQHAVIEGIAFMLMQKGCGVHAAKTAGFRTLVWCTVTFVMQMIVYYFGGIISILAQGLWSLMMLVFYGALWKLPRKNLFRRPAAIHYAQFWFWFRLLFIISFTLASSGEKTLAEIGACGHVFGPLLLFALLQPGLCYWVLLQDSRWWQGLSISQGNHRASMDTLLSPLLGADLSLSSAQTLAHTMDELMSEGSRLLNFANIFLDKSQVLGHGSFSKVYRGSYQGIPCAIKLVFTLDLTQDVIQRVAAEASILSAAKHPNVVKIYGVSVLPPSVCIVLELCSYGSLAFVLRGDTGDIFDPTNASTPQECTLPPLRLSVRDRIFLAMGCARGLCAVHNIGQGISHRDVKSFNFLVDGNLNAKLADLEMGGGDGEDGSEYLGTDEILVNWVAPEVLKGCDHTQASDMYSLGLVLWEIISGKIPYLEESGDNNADKIRKLVTTGYRPAVPDCSLVYMDLITKCWSDDPLQRYSAQHVASTLCVLWHSTSLDELEEIDAELGILPKVNIFLKSKIGVKFTKAITKFETPSCRASSLSVSSTHSGGSISLPRIDTDSLSWKGKGLTDRHMNFCVGQGVDERTSSDLAGLYKAITSDISWQISDTVDEPMLILSADIPHIILKSSAAWNEMMGYSAKQMFGHCLDHYVLAEDQLSEVHESGGGVRRRKSPLSSSSPSALSVFYDAMRTSRCAHIVTQLVDSDGDSCSCSVHSYAVRSRVSVSVGIDANRTDSQSTGSVADSLNYSTRTSADLKRTDTMTSVELKRTDTITSADSYESPLRSKSSLGGIFQRGRQPTHDNGADYYVVYVTCLDPLDIPYSIQDEGAFSKRRRDRVSVETNRQLSAASNASSRNDFATPELRKLGLASDC